MSKVAIIGTTTWGTALGIILSRKGLSINLWSRSEKEAQAMNVSRTNALFLPGIIFPEKMAVTHSLSQALKGAEMLIMAIPAQTMRTNIQLVADYLEGDTVILSASKGLEKDTALRMSEVIFQELSGLHNVSLCSLSGPNLAKEIVQGLPAISIVACPEEDIAKRAQGILTTENFLVHTNADLVGVELGGALKNIIALAAGISDGLGFGDNARAALITRGMGEITELAVAAGAQPQTLYGMAGWGDLVVTCSSLLSRNHFVGMELARGKSLKSIMHDMKNIAEGVPTTAAAKLLAKKCNVEIPIIELIYDILYAGLSPRQAILELLGFLPENVLALATKVSESVYRRE